MFSFFSFFFPFKLFFLLFHCALAIKNFFQLLQLKTECGSQFTNKLEGMFKVYVFVLHYLFFSVEGILSFLGFAQQSASLSMISVLGILFLMNMNRKLFLLYNDEIEMLLLWVLLFEC